MERVLIGEIANLKWDGSAKRYEADFMFIYKAKSVFGEYSAVFKPNEAETNLLFCDAATSFSGTLMELQEAAQKDFERRVKRCFSRSIVCTGPIEKAEVADDVQ